MDVARERRETSRPHRDGAMPPNGEIGPEEIWTEPIDRILSRLTTTRAGLAAAEVQLRATRYGPNTAATVKHLPLWLQFLARFRDAVEALRRSVAVQATVRRKRGPGSERPAFVDVGQCRPLAESAWWALSEQKGPTHDRSRLSAMVCEHPA